MLSKVHLSLRTDRDSLLITYKEMSLQQRLLWTVSELCCPAPGGLRVNKSHLHELPEHITAPGSHIVDGCSSIFGDGTLGTQ